MNTIQYFSKVIRTQDLTSLVVYSWYFFNSNVHATVHNKQKLNANAPNFSPKINHILRYYKDDFEQEQTSGHISFQSSNPYHRQQLQIK